MATFETGAEFNALISVYDKTGIVNFAAGLHELNGTIYASGGTFKEIVGGGVPATDVAELVGGEAILGHKVVTLSREVGAGLLADLNDPDEVAEMQRLGLPIIHLVCQDSYPLEAEIAKPGATPADVLKQSDIGGPTMLREAAKGGRIVLSVPEQRQLVLEWLRAGRPNEAEFVRELANRAVYEVARYSMVEAQYWNQRNMVGFIGLKQFPTKYGENPQQAEAAFYADNRIDIDPLGLDQFEQAKGWEKSFVNMTDLERLVETSTKIAAGFERNFGEVPPMAIGVKHGNACSAAIAETLEEAVEKMLEGDTRAIFGGVVMINGEITADIAHRLMWHMNDSDKERLLDGVVGSSVTDEALEILKRAKLRVITNPALANLSETSVNQKDRLRIVRGGALGQDNYTFVQDLAAEHMTYHGKELTEQQKRDCILAWAVGSTSNSNTITLVKNGMVIGNGVGQQDRVGAGQLALNRTTIETPILDDLGLSPLTEKERELSEKLLKDGLTTDNVLVMKVFLDKRKLDGAVAYSDSFFPQPDGPGLLVAAGVKAILTSSGSVMDPVVIEELQKSDVAIAMVPDKVGRGFFGH